MSDDGKVIKVEGIVGGDDAGYIIGSAIPAKGSGQDWDREKYALNPEVVRAEVLGDGAGGGGKRYNKGKNRMELTLPEWDWALADVSTKGSFKYEAWNWLKGMKWSSMIGCMKRHLAKFEAGERYDGKKFDIEAGTTGCHHLAMVAWNALALMTYDLRQIGEDDRADMLLEALERVNAATSDLED